MLSILLLIIFLIMVITAAILVAVEKKKEDIIRLSLSSALLGGQIAFMWPQLWPYIALILLTAFILKFFL